ncbi:CehA/McbA family metallohydrolase [Eudoraea adriatica]|uniref:CehA/McbA family metallohydrolase n=1 Tax=Eudoraea adriatica TaxID=446681 RepID=UPI000370FC2F|nr:CehA/McbA family metallohydrolase [Eudoraea adriatica]
MKTAAIIVSLVFSLIFVTPSYGHDGHADPVLQEINDYLMAIQLMRIKDAAAANIFKTWHELRTESWEIRNLTDEQNLLISAETVMKQISKTRAKQKQLLQECRAYFAKLVEQGPAIRFIVNQSITASWDSPALEVQEGHFKVVLVEVQNNSTSKVQLSMKSDYSDEILFWNKQFSLEANASRFTFVVLSPLSAGKVRSTLRINDDVGRKAEAILSFNAIPMTEKPFVLTPDSIPTHVVVRGYSGHPIDKEPDFAESINFSITDKVSGEPLAARVEVSDKQGNHYWTPINGPSFAVNRYSEWGWHTALWEYQPGPYFYLRGKAELGVSPTGKKAKIYHGFEYIPAKVEVPEQGNVNIALERWINMPELGWYSGQTHIHTTDIGIPVQFSNYWPLISQAEDLHVSSILTLKGEWETHAIYADEYPIGKRKAFSTSDHIITYGEEFRNNPYGHLAFIGLKSLIQPISTGALGELGGPDYPPNACILEDAVAQGATTIAAHFGNFTEGVDQIRTGWPSTGFEMPVDIALENIHMAEIAGNGGQMKVWYDILNCGFKIPATAGPDWAIKDTPRVYVNLENEEFTLDNWRRNLQRGKSFITTGPMIFFKVNGEQPGSTLNVEKGPVSLEIDARALTPDGRIPVEIVYNGVVVLSGTEVPGKITLEDSGWIAARCEGAHSNPVYIHFKDRPAGYAEPAEKFITTIDRLSEWVNTKALFYDENQKREVLEVIGKGRAVYENIIQRAAELKRK